MFAVIGIAYMLIIKYDFQFIQNVSYILFLLGFVLLL